MHEFLKTYRETLIARCHERAARRCNQSATPAQYSDGIALFLDQLQRTLKAEKDGEAGEILKIAGASASDALQVSEMGESAAAYGKELLRLGCSVAQVVYGYGDLCQAITDLAFECNIPFTVDEFRTLNRCLDRAIAYAVTEFSFQHDAALAHAQLTHENERLGFLAHELRNSLTIATLAVTALEAGSLPISGATGAVLKRSLTELAIQIDQALDQVRFQAAQQSVERQVFSLASFIATAKADAELEARARGCAFEVAAVDPLLAIAGDRSRLLAALGNLLQNGFKFTHPHTAVLLKAYAVGEQVFIEVHDHCGGLPAGNAESMFTPFSQRHDDQTGLGLGLAIARRSIVANAGTLGVRNLPGHGCIFTVCLKRHVMPSALAVAGR